MVKAVAFLSVVAVLGAASSCVDSSPLPSVESFCDGWCRGAARCNNSLSRQDCYDGCVADPQNLPSIRPEAAAVVHTCLSELDCDAIFTGDLDSCWDLAREKTAPSGHLLEFCPTYSTFAFECGSSFSVEDCRATLNIFTDQFLDALAACTRAATCEATNACLEQRFGGS